MYEHIKKLVYRITKNETKLKGSHSLLIYLFQDMIILKFYLNCLRIQNLCASHYTEISNHKIYC